MAHSPAFLVTYPIPEVGMAALRAAGRVHVPAQPPTPQDLRKLCSSDVDGDVLAAMKPTAMLINTARGPVVDEVALVSALHDGIIAAAGLDAYENEPHLAPGLIELPNVVLLPHLGSATVQVRNRMADLCAANAVAVAAGHLPPHCVNPTAWH